MDDLLYESCLRYFTSLSTFGYRNEEDVKKLLFYVYIQELVNITPFSISEEDYKHLEGALYQLYGTTCLMPYPDYCEKAMVTHLGDIYEIAARLKDVEEENIEQNDRLTTIENTKVVKDEQEDVDEITDINT